MIRVYKIRATIGGQLIGFDSQPLPEDFEDMEAAETAIRAFNDDKQELFVWEPAVQITVPPDSVVCMFEDFDDMDHWVSVWIAVAEEHTRMLTRDMVESRLDDGALPPVMSTVLTKEEAQIVMQPKRHGKNARLSGDPVLPPIMPTVVTEEEAQRIRAAGPGEILPQQVKRGEGVFNKMLDWAAGNDLSVLTEMTLSGNEARVVVVDEVAEPNDMIFGIEVVTRLTGEAWQELAKELNRLTGERREPWDHVVAVARVMLQIGEPWDSALAGALTFAKTSVFPVALYRYVEKKRENDERLRASLEPHKEAMTRLAKR